MERCENCFLYMAGDCNGVTKVCNDYRGVPIISKREKENWEKEGDASRYRRQFRRKNSGGYSINKISYVNGMIINNY